MTGRTRPGLAVLTALLLWPGGAIADSPRPGSQEIVLFPLEGPGSLSVLEQELERALRQAGQQVQRSALGLDDLLLAVACADRSAACLQQVCQNINATGLVLGRVSAGEPAGKHELSLRLFDAQRGLDSGQARAWLPADPARRRDVLARAVRQLLGQPAPSSRPTAPRGGSLALSSTVPQVEVSIDGQRRGTLPLHLRGVEARSYALRAGHEGFLPWARKVRVEPGQTTYVRIDLAPDPSYRARRGLVESIRLATWLVAGAGVASLVAALACGAHMQAMQNDLDELDGVTLEEIRQMEQIRDQGERDALAANVLFGLGGGALVAAGIMALLDYTRARRTGPPAGIALPRVALDGAPLGIHIQF